MKQSNRIKEILKNWPTYLMGCTKNRYPEGKNQCDGCVAGIPIVNGNHRIDRE